MHVLTSHAWSSGARERSRGRDWGGDARHGVLHAARAAGPVGDGADVPRVAAEVGAGHLRERTKGRYQAKECACVLVEVRAGYLGGK